ncbi:APC family permease [Cryptosporangium aurantiacum]|uniref:Amino acid/polyamine/organocation transporter, APC superfamily n=1 Tax=Cryptosporangium aurantiacum TaxID=134849 RepID=A0A1M7RA36_9ACTN|nr:APC family permease [Cryptosporangium aurantiacum]SHN43184.1 amino acid/polyamine/organocation transporter, APC superfamily [Cryptosporangium aurantiacum]
MAGDGPRLGRELSIWEAVGISVALMAPSMAANINPQGMVGNVGRAVPLTFALATVGVLLVAYTFVRLTQKFHHSGSVYGFVGATLGARPGVVAGWGLLGTYLFYAVVTSTASARFLVAFLDGTGLWDAPPDWIVLPLAALVLLGVLWLTVSPIRLGTRVLLVVEAATVALILIVAVVILVKLLGDDAPGGQSVTFSPFTVPDGTATSALFLGVVFGFLSFAGFEAAATLGEETRHPRRDIPRAILGTAIFGGLYFVFVTWVEVMGFGTDAAGLDAFANSGSLFGDLGTQYVGAWLGDLISLGAAISAFGCALACSVGASRLLYAMARDGIAPAPLARVSPTKRTPVGAAIGVAVAAAVIEVLLWLVYRTGTDDTSLSVFVAAGVIGTLVLLVVYVLASVGVIRLLFIDRDPRVRTWEVVVPVGGLIVLGYTLYRNVIPLPEGRSLIAPVVAALWLLAGLVFVLAAPRLARRAGEALTADEGLTAAKERA